MRKLINRFNWVKAGILIFGVVLLLSVSWKFYYERKRQYWGEEPYRIGVYENRGGEGRLAAISYYPQGNIAQVFVFDNQAKLTAASDFGLFTPAKLYSLDQQEKAHGKIVSQTLANNLGMYIRSTSISDRKKGQLPDITTAWVRQKLSSSRTPSGSWLAQTTDKVLLWWQLIDLRNKNLEVTELKNQNIWDRGESSDGGEERVFNPALFDRLINVHRYQLNQETPITVVNLADKAGLGLLISRILEREGFSVARVESGTNGNNQTGSKITINGNKLEPKLLDRLKMITGIQTVEIVDTADRIRATIYLGGDYAKY